MKTGRVYIVGAGPGDPDLLTLKADRLIRKADVVLYDALVSPDILSRIPEHTETIYVGKRSASHQLPQQDINQLLISYANKGLNTLRLKGGDPYIFGRGGEEVEDLIKANISFEVVPGITAASGCASYAGIPLTHRDYSQSVRLITAHHQHDGTDLPWNELVAPNQTLVFYMGLSGLSRICHQLIHHGANPSLPVALVSKGTTREQQVLRGTLSTLPDEQARQNLPAPTLIIIGKVAALDLSNTEI